MWTEGLEQLKMYAYDPEAQEVPVSPQGIKVPGGCLILSYTGAESQDNGLGLPELETKENQGSDRSLWPPYQPCLGTIVC